MNNLKGLFVFSITNMLERFAFYAMMAILVLSFTEGSGYSNEQAGTFYTIFYTAVYISTLLMGLLGDFINRKQIVYTGIIGLVIGYFLYYLMPKGNEITLIIPGIIFVLGYGAFKTNLLVQVGDLYKHNIKNGSLGYLIYYAFINLGAIFAPFTSIYLKREYGMDSIFLLSGGVTILAFLLYYLVPISTESGDSPTNSKPTIIDDIIDTPEFAPTIKSITNVKFGADKIIALIFLILFVPAFWMAYHQNGLVLTMYIRDLVAFGGFDPAYFQTVNPIAIVLLTLIIVPIIYHLVKLKRTHSILAFIAIGIILATIGYSIPIFELSNFSGKLPYQYAIIPLVMISLSEVFIVPFLTLGFYQFSPEKLKGLFMGLFLTITALGNNLLFYYARTYQVFGAVNAFMSIVIHILICAVVFLIVWLIIRRLQVRQ